MGRGRGGEGRYDGWKSVTADETSYNEQVYGQIMYRENFFFKRR